MFDLIGVDWGSKVFGVAFSNSQTEIIIPSKLVYPSNRALELIIDELDQRKIKTVILGYPTNINKGKTLVSEKIEGFKKQLEELKNGIKIIFVNERYTSSDVDNSLKNSSLSHNLAACNILRNYFEAITK